jgi:acyl carrier protein
MPQPVTIDGFIRNFEDAIEDIEPNSLSPDTPFTELVEWDSLAALSILAMIDAEYDTAISGKELRASKTLKDLFEVVRSKA